MIRLNFYACSIYIHLMQSLVQQTKHRKVSFLHLKQPYDKMYIIEKRFLDFTSSNNNIRHFTFMLPCCIVIDSFLNNQLDALIIQIYSVIKLYTFGASSLSIIMMFSTVRSALVSSVQVFDDRFQAVIKKLHETYQCRM